MRKKSLLIVALIAMCFQGCIVKSLHPFYTEKDVVYNKALEGEWRDSDNKKWKIHQNRFKPNSYEIHQAVGEREIIYVVHLFKINDDLYLDMIPNEVNTEEDDDMLFNLHIVPTHSIAKVEKLTNQQFTIKWFNEEWLRRMFVENRIKIRHETVLGDKPGSNDGMYVLTASTGELQAFVAKYGNDDKAYDTDLRLQLTK